jgi:hypothetical protein
MQSARHESPHRLFRRIQSCDTFRCANITAHIQKWQHSPGMAELVEGMREVGASHVCRPVETSCSPEMNRLTAAQVAKMQAQWNSVGPTKKKSTINYLQNLGNGDCEGQHYTCGRCQLLEPPTAPGVCANG